MNKKYWIILTVSFFCLTAFGWLKSEWGFFGHRKINRMAVFTLPPEMIGFYKKNIEFVTEHSVDPDKRRYAAKGEAIRHYIDIDHWGELPFDQVPRNLWDAMKMYGDLYVIDANLDTTQVYKSKEFDFAQNKRVEQSNPYFTKAVYDSLCHQILKQSFLEEQIYLSADSLLGLDLSSIDQESISSVYFENNFIQYGILPYHLKFMQTALEKAFVNKNEAAILRLSAEMGHYVGDAHVPLHTTENYNGQFSDQLGIHGFWESRIPELFAEAEYDFFVGKAQYIDHEKDYFWDIVLKSHSHLDSLLSIEKELSQTYPSDQIYCYEERLERTIRTYCTEYSAAYQERMEGMVEERMRASILAIGSCWFTAWVNAGQPDLDFSKEISLSKEEIEAQNSLDSEYKKGTIKGREHN